MSSNCSSIVQKRRRLALWFPFRNILNTRRRLKNSSWVRSAIS
jgi:hypothetical protein